MKIRNVNLAIAEVNNFIIFLFYLSLLFTHTQKKQFIVYQCLFYFKL